MYKPAHLTKSQHCLTGHSQDGEQLHHPIKILLRHQLNGLVYITPNYSVCCSWLLFPEFQINEIICCYGLFYLTSFCKLLDRTMLLFVSSIKYEHYVYILYKQT